MSVTSCRRSVSGGQPWAPPLAPACTNVRHVLHMMRCEVSHYTRCALLRGALRGALRGDVRGALRGAVRGAHRSWCWCPGRPRTSGAAPPRIGAARLGWQARAFASQACPLRHPRVAGSASGQALRWRPTIVSDILLECTMYCTMEQYTRGQVSCPYPWEALGACRPARAASGCKTAAPCSSNGTAP